MPLLKPMAVMSKLSFLVLLILFSQTQAHGADSDYAYYGMASAIQYGCQGTVKSGLHLEANERWKSRFFCSLFTGAIILVTAARDESAKKGNAIGYGTFGIASAMGLSYAFDF